MLLCSKLEVIDRLLDFELYFLVVLIDMAEIEWFIEIDYANAQESRLLG